MSLDVYLINEDPAKRGGSGIFVRQDGATKEITRAEWDAAFPGREPVIVQDPGGHVYWRNITHNLTDMARAAGIYEALWRPEDVGITHAHQMIGPLSTGLARLRYDPAKYEAMNPANGWGTYGGFVDFVESYLAACREHPHAAVSVRR